MGNELLQAISLLSEIRSKYSCFDEEEQPYYYALSLAIKSIRKQIEPTEQGSYQPTNSSTSNRAPKPPKVKSAER